MRETLPLIQKSIRHMELSRIYPNNNPVSMEMLSDLITHFNDDTEVRNSLLKWPNEVTLCENERCCNCGGEIIRMYFRSGPETWENLCGREGYMKICSSCKRRLSMVITVMN